MIVYLSIFWLLGVNIVMSGVYWILCTFCAMGFDVEVVHSETFTEDFVHRSSACSEALLNNRNLLLFSDLNKMTGEACIMLFYIIEFVVSLRLHELSLRARQV